MWGEESRAEGGFFALRFVPRAGSSSALCGKGAAGTGFVVSLRFAPGVESPPVLGGKEGGATGFVGLLGFGGLAALGFGAGRAMGGFEEGKLVLDDSNLPFRRECLELFVSTLHS